MNRRSIAPIPAGLLIHEDRIFILHSLDSKQKFVVLTQEPVTVQTAQNAWTHAVRYTAKALDIPDYEAAVRMMLERHPTWTIIESLCPSVQVDLDRAGEDIAEV